MLLAGGECSGSIRITRMWFSAINAKKNIPFEDGRHFEVNPDTIADFTDLPFEDARFKLVVFDPPHLLRNTGKSKFATIYGSLNDAPQRLTGYQHIKYGQHIMIGGI